MPNMSAAEDNATLKHEVDDIVAVQHLTLLSSAAGEGEECRFRTVSKARQPQPRVSYLAPDAE